MNRKNNNRITIWTSIDLIVPCLKAKLRREFPSADENEITALMHSVNFRYFEDMKAKLDEVSIGKPIIVIASFSDPFNKDNCSNHVKVIDSGNLGECFDEDFDLAEWYKISTLRNGISTKTATSAPTTLTGRVSAITSISLSRKVLP